MSDKLLMAEDFNDKIGSEFTIDLNFDNAPDITLKLTECTLDPRPKLEQSKRQGFSLIFEGDLNMVLPSQTYQLKCDTLDEPLHLLLTPVGKTNEATEYQAVFN